MVADSGNQRQSSALAVVLGGAECLWSDVEALGALVDIETCMIGACNDAGCEWPGRLDHWATMHPEQLADRKARRAANGYPDGYKTWGHTYPYGLKERERMVDDVLDGWGGSSGLLTVGALLASGARKIVLCGVPMDVRPHFNRDGSPWSVAERYRERWIERADELRRHVRSMSGWTRETFGEPTEEWLHG